MRRRRAQGLQQPVRVVADRPHSHLHEQLGQGLRHHAPVGHHVADAARHPDVVLQHAPVAELVADQVDAADVDPHPVLGLDAVRLPVVVRRRRDAGGGDHAVADAALRAVDVGQERFERPDPLGDAEFDARPVVGVDDAGNRVERKRPLLPREVESDSLGQIRIGERLGAPP
jgi:hypothetical protein